MNFHTLLIIFNILNFLHKIYDICLKRPKNHTGHLNNYTWDKDECIKFVKNTTEKTILNFSELARKHKLRNFQGKKFFI